MYSCIFVCFGVFLLVIQSNTQDITVDTDVGTYIGKKSDVTIADTTYTVGKFLGIPFAEPPLGNLRFKIPIKKAPHRDPMIVQEYSKRCMEMFPFYQLPQAEDCLYLNVVVPEKIEIEKLPVMVWIHGGGFIQGSANEYNVDSFAAYGNVIVVSMNYRLGIWGFLSTEDSNSPGNYGLWDQRLALQWVKDNIERFGGDTSRITIFGESAGGASVIYQGLFPGNKGLFHRMIAQSGSAAATWGQSTAPKKLADDFAKYVGCHDDNVATMLNCLRNLNSGVIYNATNGVNNAPYFMFGPTTDNVFVTCGPEDLLNLNKRVSNYQESRETFASFDMLTGINSGEGAMAFDPAYGYGDPETFLPNISYFSNVLVSNFVAAGFEGRVEASNADRVRRAVIDKYTDGNTISDPYVLREKVADMFSDALFLAPMQMTLETHAKLSTKSTYMYFLSVNPSYHVLPTPDWYEKANHADDIQYIFPSEMSPFDEQEVLLSELMVSSWTNFAKTGDPNLPRDRNMNWKEYTENNPRYLDLKRGSTSADVKEGLFEDRGNFWNQEMPPIIGYTRAPCDYVLDTSSAPAMFTRSNLVFVILGAVLSNVLQV